MHNRTSKADLTSGPLIGHLIRMAWPTALGVVLQSLYSMVDTFWLGKLGDSAGTVAVAATGSVRPVLFIAVALGFGLSAGGTAMVAQFTGAGRQRQADRSAGQTILLLCSMGVLAALPVAILAPWILSLMRAPEELILPATLYLRIFILGLPFMAFSLAYASVMRALGDTITAVLIGVATNVLNLVLDPLLILGLWRFPRMGIQGAALASAFCQVVGALGCYACMARGRAGLHVERTDFVPDWPLIRRIVAVAVPAGLGSGLNSIGFAIFQTIINSFGTTVVGAFTIGFQVLHFFNAPMQAMGAATAPIVGQALGAGKVPIARRAVRLSVCLVGSFMLVPAFFLMFNGQWIARLFVQDSEVIAESGRFFQIVPFSSYFFGVVMVLMGAFYGAGHTLPAMVVSVLRILVRIVAALYLAFVVGLGNTGAYAGMVVGNVTCATLALYLFLRGGWEKAVIPHTAEGTEE
jgi:putative MATE family efflux protein